MTTAFSRLHDGPRLALALLLLLALLLPLGLLPRPAAATCAVTTNADSGAGSLREKLADTTCDTSTLTSGHLTIGRSVKITGPGAGSLAISGSDASRVFFITTGTVAISGLTITHGRTVDESRAGLRISGNALAVTLTDCIVTANTSAGTTTSKGTGGGIGTSAGTTLTLVGSTISDNTANYYGGGLSIFGGTATLLNSTISGNTAVNSDGGVLSSPIRARSR
jgi:hypothetical protein